MHSDMAPPSRADLEADYANATTEVEAAYLRALNARCAALCAETRQAQEEELREFPAAVDAHKNAMIYLGATAEALTEDMRIFQRAFEELRGHLMKQPWK